MRKTAVAASLFLSEIFGCPSLLSACEIRRGCCWVACGGNKNGQAIFFVWRVAVKIKNGMKFHFFFIKTRTSAFGRPRPGKERGPMLLYCAGCVLHPNLKNCCRAKMKQSSSAERLLSSICRADPAVSRACVAAAVEHMKKMTKMTDMCAGGRPLPPPFSLPALFSLSL